MFGWYHVKIWLWTLEQGCECTFSRRCGPQCVGDMDHHASEQHHGSIRDWNLLATGGAQGFGWSWNNIWLILCLEFMDKEDLVAYLCWNIDQIGVELLGFSIFLSISLGFIALDLWSVKVPKDVGWILAWWILQLSEEMTDLPYSSPSFFFHWIFLQPVNLIRTASLSWILSCSCFQLTLLRKVWVKL